MHPCFPVQSKTQSTGTKHHPFAEPGPAGDPGSAAQRSPAQPGLSPPSSSPPQPGEGQTRLGRKAKSAPGLSHPSLRSRQACPSRGFLPTPAGQAGRHPQRGSLPMVEWSRAQPMDRGAPEGAWTETAVTRALGSGRVLPACLQSLPGRLYPPDLPHPVSGVEKRNPHPSTHTPCHVICSSTSSPRMPSQGQ